MKTTTFLEDVDRAQQKEVFVIPGGLGCETQGSHDFPGLHFWRAISTRCDTLSESVQD